MVNRVPTVFAVANFITCCFYKGRPAKYTDFGGRKCLQMANASPGGFILGPGCGLPVNAPPVNVYAMTKAAHDFGWYE